MSASIEPDGPAYPKGGPWQIWEGSSVCRVLEGGYDLFVKSWKIETSRTTRISEAYVELLRPYTRGSGLHRPICLMTEEEINDELMDWWSYPEGELVSRRLAAGERNTDGGYKAIFLCAGDLVTYSGTSISGKYQEPLEADKALLAWLREHGKARDWDKEVVLPKREDLLEKARANLNKAPVPVPANVKPMTKDQIRLLETMISGAAHSMQGFNSKRAIMSGERLSVDIAAEFLGSSMIGLPWSTFASIKENLDAGREVVTMPESMLFHTSRSKTSFMFKGMEIIIRTMEDDLFAVYVYKEIT